VTDLAGFSKSSKGATAGTASCCCVLVFSTGLTFLLISSSSELSDSSLMGWGFLGYEENTTTGLENTNA
jgi:hypothetical protein